VVFLFRSTRAAIALALVWWDVGQRDIFGDVVSIGMARSTTLVNAN
jgi:hypothetical protein